ncbi:hypothetical protein NJB18001_15990, partial [Mycobacterium marinum]
MVCMEQTWLLAAALTAAMAATAVLVVSEVPVVLAASVVRLTPRGSLTVPPGPAATADRGVPAALVPGEAMVVTELTGASLVRHRMAARAVT